MHEHPAHGPTHHPPPHLSDPRRQPPTGWGPAPHPVDQGAAAWPTGWPPPHHSGSVAPGHHTGPHPVPDGGRSWTPWLLVVGSVAASTLLLVAVFLLAGPGEPTVAAGSPATGAGDPATPGDGPAGDDQAAPAAAETTTTTAPPTTTTSAPPPSTVDTSPADFDEDRMQDHLVETVDCVPVDGLESLLEERSVETSFGCILPGVTIEAILGVSPSTADLFAESIVAGWDHSDGSCPIGISSGPWALIVVGEEPNRVGSTARTLSGGDAQVFDGCGSLETGGSTSQGDV